MVRAPALGFVATGEGEDESYAAGVSTHGHRSPAFDAVRPSSRVEPA
jgi:hypothetical protein